VKNEIFQRVAESKITTEYDMGYHSAAAINISS